MGKVKNGVDYEDADSLVDLRFDDMLKKKFGTLDHNVLSEQYDNGCVHDSEEEEELQTDPQYKMFLENLIEYRDGKSFSVEIQMGYGISEIICYEEKGEGLLKNTYRKRKFKHDSQRVATKVPKKLGDFSRKAERERLKTGKKSIVNKNKAKKKAYSANCKLNGEPSKKMNGSCIDESWAHFIDYLNKQKIDESCSDVEMFELNEIVREGHCTPFVPSKCLTLPGEKNWDHINASSKSQFRENLMDLLKKPYDRQEFENLWRLVTHRIPADGSEELTGRTKQYLTKNKGKSYLDWHKELKMKIDEFRGEFKDDRRKILYLLRGFFFWLKNICHEGAFRPWLDSSYLNALG